jgi:hypothetical protein
MSRDKISKNKAWTTSKVPAVIRTRLSRPSVVRV